MVRDRVCHVRASAEESAADHAEIGTPPQAPGTPVMVRPFRFFLQAQENFSGWRIYQFEIVNRYLNVSYNVVDTISTERNGHAIQTGSDFRPAAIAPGVKLL